jgi:hypothetical protein
VAVRARVVGNKWTMIGQRGGGGRWKAGTEWRPNGPRKLITLKYGGVHGIFPKLDIFKFFKFLHARSRDSEHFLIRIIIYDHRRRRPLSFAEPIAMKLGINDVR